MPSPVLGPGHFKVLPPSALGYAESLAGKQAWTPFLLNHVLRDSLLLISQRFWFWGQTEVGTPGPFLDMTSLSFLTCTLGID